MPSNFAYLSLFIWPVVVFILFAAIMCYSRLQMHKAQGTRRRISGSAGTLWAARHAKDILD